MKCAVEGCERLVVQTPGVGRERKYCSTSCRLAVNRVRCREAARYRRKLALARSPDVTSGDSHRRRVSVDILNGLGKSGGGPSRLRLDYEYPFGSFHQA